MNNAGAQRKRVTVQKAKRSVDVVGTGEKHAVPEGYKRLSINIPKTLHRKIKMRAALQGTTMGKLIAEWVEGLPEY